MKKILLAILILGTIATSCKKEQPIAKTDVIFKFSNFNWEVTPLAKGSSEVSDVGEDIGDTLSKHADYFYYRAYNTAGVKVSEKSQLASDPGFGTISDVLDPGTYTVVFTASRKPIGFSKYGLNSDHFYNMDNGYWDDTFFQKSAITVGSEAAEHDVTLKRVVGALEVTVLDAIPLNAAKIAISAEYEHGVYHLKYGSTSATDTKTKVFTLTNSDKGQSERKFLMHILNLSRALRITIKSLDAQNIVLNSKTVDNVMFYQNRKTILRGNLSSAAQFTVTVDPVWGTPTAPILF